MSEPTPILIENGRLIDPSQHVDRPARLLLRRGRVEAIDPPAVLPSHRRGWLHRRAGLSGLRSRVP